MRPLNSLKNVCTQHKEFFIAKFLLKLHLWATQHHSLESQDESCDEESTDVTDVDVETLSKVVDGACVIPFRHKILESVWDIAYEWNSNENFWELFCLIPFLIKLDM